MYKTETHLHTSDVSECSRITAREMVRVYHDLGYSTVFVSDHLYPLFFDKLGDIPWVEKTAIFLTGYYKAKVEGERVGVNVLMSAEIEFRESNNHYLVYGIDKKFLDSYPDILEMGIAKFSQIAKKHNLLLIQAHPHRDRNNTPTPEYVDGIEAVNPNPRHENYEEDCFELAFKYGIYTTSGSDAHRMEDVGRGGVITETEIKTAEDYINAVKSGNLKLHRNYGDKQ